MLSQVLSVLSSALTAGGTLLVVWGGIKAAIALPNHNGPDIQNGLLCVVGGAAVMLLAAFVTNVTV